MSTPGIDEVFRGWNSYDANEKEDFVIVEGTVSPAGSAGGTPSMNHRFVNFAPVIPRTLAAFVSKTREGYTITPLAAVNCTEKGVTLFLFKKLARQHKRVNGSGLLGTEVVLTDWDSSTGTIVKRDN